jgi:hypothetical protein
MPNRMLRDYTDSERMAGLSADAERLYIRLITKADDYGRFHSDPRLIKALCFPLEEQLRANDLSRWLEELSTRQLILCYEAEKKKCLAIPNYGQRLKQSKAKFPPFPGEPITWLPDFREVPGSSGKFPPEEKGREYEVEEKGREGKSELATPSPSDELFAMLREIFPDSSLTAAPAEQRELDEARSVISEFTSEDWTACKAWVKAPDRIRGRKLWPRNRREFVQNAAEAIEKIRPWWKKDGRKWANGTKPIPIEPKGRTEDVPELTREEMSALLRGD